MADPDIAKLAHALTQIQEQVSVLSKIVLSQHTQSQQPQQTQSSEQTSAPNAARNIKLAGAEPPSGRPAGSIVPLDTAYRYVEDRFKDRKYGKEGSNGITPSGRPNVLTPMESAITKEARAKAKTQAPLSVAETSETEPPPDEIATEVQLRAFLKDSKDIQHLQAAITLTVDTVAYQLGTGLLISKEDSLEEIFLVYGGKAVSKDTLSANVEYFSQLAEDAVVALDAEGETNMNFTARLSSFQLDKYGNLLIRLVDGVPQGGLDILAQYR